MIRWLRLLLATAAMTAVASCGGGSDDPPVPNIVQTAQADPQFSIPAEAVVAADLAGTLSGNGTFTVFAPTNAAFAALLAELGTTKEALLANKPLLTAAPTSSPPTCWRATAWCTSSTA